MIKPSKMTVKELAKHLTFMLPKRQVQSLILALQDDIKCLFTEQDLYKAYEAGKNGESLVIKNNDKQDIGIQGDNQ